MEDKLSAEMETEFTSGKGEDEPTEEETKSE